jgi:hypothetical protein
VTCPTAFQACDVYQGAVRWPRYVGSLQQDVLANRRLVWLESSGPTSTTPHMDMTGGASTVLAGHKLFCWWDA